MREQKAKDLEVARLRALQEHEQDKIAERHALEARRQQYELERQVCRGWSHGAHVHSGAARRSSA